LLKSWSWLDSVFGLPESFLQWTGVEVYHNILLYVPRLNRENKKSQKQKFSVVTLIIDGLSQLNFIRSLPLTKTFLDGLGGFLFRGQHKVGHNSYPNVMALLSGETGGDWPADWPNRTGMYYLDKERRETGPLIGQTGRECITLIKSVNPF